MTATQDVSARSPIARYEHSVIDRIADFQDPRQAWRRLLRTVRNVLARPGGGRWRHDGPHDFGRDHPRRRRVGVQLPAETGQARIEFCHARRSRAHVTRPAQGQPGEAITEVSQRMVERNLGAVLVFDGGRLAGILTERDLMRAVARGCRATQLSPST